MIVLTDKLGFRSRPFRMFWSDFMYTIGQVSQMCGIPVSTLRYYDKEGLFPHMERVSGIRRFSDRELETLRIIDCLKKSGLEIREIRKFMQWCAEGSSSYPQRRELFENQKKTVEKEIERLQKTLDMLRFKCWYYDTAIADGNEDRINEMLPNNLPDDIQKLYDHAHSDD
jgi:DNA-binding transcriptional MerR regulator